MIKRCRLNIDSKERPVVSSDDFYDLLFTLHTAPLKLLYMRNERQRFVLWLFEHVAGYTGSRPVAPVSRRPERSRSLKLDVSDSGGHDSVSKSCGLMRESGHHTPSNIEHANGIGTISWFLGCLRS
jgi:hypothetical protein